MSFLTERFPGRPPEKADLGDLIFEPDPEAVVELGRFLRLETLLFRISECVPLLALHLPCGLIDCFFYLPSYPIDSTS